MKRAELRRGDVVLVNLDPVVGNEIGKTRPALVVQNDVGNRYSPTVIVVAITEFGADKARFPICVPLEAGDGGLAKRSMANASQVRTVDRRRIVGAPLGRLAVPAMAKVDAALRISLELE
ncbi:MAG: type II toxin-antitoxin system PemK/MazF family toxin [Deltaproteobacteria bacterium]|nr:type II toxin-antitoxin system PemK/MazF family toxin [Deltaproteobacteria bacterium]